MQYTYKTLDDASIISFQDDMRQYTYNKIEFRCPVEGEFYLSGGASMAYLAPKDMTNEYWIVSKDKEAIRRTVYELID